MVFSPDFLGFGDPEAAPEGTAADGEAAADGEDEDKQDNTGGTSNEDLMRRYRQNADMPTDLGSAAEQFGEDFRSILLRSDATAAAYRDKASRARYIHIASVDASSDGGFKLADGTLSLAELRTQPLQAEIVIVTASAPAAVQHTSPCAPRCGC